MAECFVYSLFIYILVLYFILNFYIFNLSLMFSNATSSLFTSLLIDLNLFSGHGFGTHIVIRLILILLYLISLNCRLLISFFHTFLRWFLLYFCTLRHSLRDVIFDFVQNIWIGLYTVVMIVDVVFLSLSSPRVLANHVKISLSRLFKLFIFLEGVFFKTISTPREQIEHIGVLFSIFSWFSKNLLGKVDFIVIILWNSFTGRRVHFEK